jgi:hypothetical protein
MNPEILCAIQSKSDSVQHYQEEYEERLERSHYVMPPRIFVTPGSTAARSYY